MQLRDARHSAELLSFAYSTKRNMQPPPPSYLSSRFLSYCAVPYAPTKTYLYVEAIISIPESVSCRSFYLHPGKEIVKLNCITCLSPVDDVIQEMKPA